MNNKPHGNGTAIYPDGSKILGLIHLAKFKGRFNRGTAVGSGKLTHKDKQKYDIKFKKNKKVRRCQPHSSILFVFIYDLGSIQKK